MPTSPGAMNVRYLSGDGNDSFPADGHRFGSNVIKTHEPDIPSYPCKANVPGNTTACATVFSVIILSFFVSVVSIWCSRVLIIATSACWSCWCHRRLVPRRSCCAYRSRAGAGLSTAGR